MGADRAGLPVHQLPSRRERVEAFAAALKAGETARVQQLLGVLVRRADMARASLSDIRTLNAELDGLHRRGLAVVGIDPGAYRVLGQLEALMLILDGRAAEIDALERHKATAGAERRLRERRRDRVEGLDAI